MGLLDTATVATITVICFAIGFIVKNLTAMDNRKIPALMAAAGAALGIAGFYLMPDFPAGDILSAAAVGIASGLAATGIHQIYKQTTGDDTPAV